MKINNETIISGLSNQKKIDKKNIESFSDILTNGMSEKKDIGENKYEGGGWAYVDKYGFSHVVADFKTAQEFKMNSTQAYQYNGKYGGGYALSEENERMRVGLEKEVPYGNESDAEKKSEFIDKKYLGLSVDPYKYLKIIETQEEFLNKEGS